jgi:hypothetical protein
MICVVNWKKIRQFASTADKQWDTKSANTKGIWKKALCSRSNLARIPSAMLIPVKFGSYFP